MPTLPEDIVMRPFTGATWLVQARIIVSRVFQKTMGELGMGRFISYSGRTASVTDVYDVLLEALLKSYVCYIGLPFILNYAGDFIYKSPVLRPFFDQWQMCRDYFTAREGQRWRQVDNGSWAGWRDAVLSGTGYSASLYGKFNPRESLLNVERYKASRLLEIRDDQALDPLAFCKLPGQLLKETTEPDKFFYYQKEGIPLVSVFIGLDIFILFSNIYLLDIYRKGITVKVNRERIPAWVKDQSARLTTTDGVKGKEYFDQLGKLRFRIPMLEELGRVAEFNTYNLKYYLDLSKMPVELLHTEPWTWQITPCPDMVYYWLERWTIPGYELLHQEPWSPIGPSEPPEFELVFTEPWGEIQWQLIYTEPWTAIVMPWGYGYIYFKEKWG